MRIRLKEPDATLPVVLGMAEAAILSEEWMRGKPNIKVEANGTGPFVMAGWYNQMNPLPVISPSVALFLAVFSINTLGDWLQDWLNPEVAPRSLSA